MSKRYQGTMKQKLSFIHFRKLVYVRGKKYVESSFYKNCEETITEKNLSSKGVSRRLVQGHLLLRILLHNFQRPSAMANTTISDFTSVNTKENGDWVVQVYSNLLLFLVTIA